ncbi:hypothetical protein BX666DRAFT_1363072 [Dichotomocladium elegans]|nr:hypothetical protein BX666DRAFT_1363072 [Dichotomocladium elegans]
MLHWILGHDGHALRGFFFFLLRWGFPGNILGLPSLLTATIGILGWDIVLSIPSGSLIILQRLVLYRIVVHFLASLSVLLRQVGSESKSNKTMVVKLSLCTWKMLVVKRTPCKSEPRNDNA